MDLLWSLSVNVYHVPLARKLVISETLFPSIRSLGWYRGRMMRMDVTTDTVDSPIVTRTNTPVYTNTPALIGNHYSLLGSVSFVG